MTLQQMYTEDRREVCQVSWPPVKIVERPEKCWRVRTEPISESLLKEIKELGRNFIVGEYTLHNLLKVEWWPYQPSDEEYAAYLMFADCLGSTGGRDDDA